MVFKEFGRKVDLAEWAVGVAPASRPADILLAVLAGEAVRVVEADLDAHLLARAGLLCVRDAALSESTFCVTATTLSGHNQMRMWMKSDLTWRQTSRTQT